MGLGNPRQFPFRLRNLKERFLKLTASGCYLSARRLKDETGTIYIATANPVHPSHPVNPGGRGPREDSDKRFGQVATCPYRNMELERTAVGMRLYINPGPVFLLADFMGTFRA